MLTVVARNHFIELATAIGKSRTTVKDQPTRIPSSASGMRILGMAGFGVPGSLGWIYELSCTPPHPGPLPFSLGEETDGRNRQVTPSSITYRPKSRTIFVQATLFGEASDEEQLVRLDQIINSPHNCLSPPSSPPYTAHSHDGSPQQLDFVPPRQNFPNSSLSPEEISLMNLFSVESISSSRKIYPFQFQWYRARLRPS